MSDEIGLSSKRAQRENLKNQKRRHCEEEEEGTGHEDLVRAVQLYSTSAERRKKYEAILNMNSSDEAKNVASLSFTSVRKFLTLELLIYGGGNRADAIRNMTIEVR